MVTPLSVYRVEVTYNAPEKVDGKPLYIGLVILGSSGDVDGYPKSEQQALLRPG